MELSLTDVLGPGATQTATTITISKADLAGLTANTNNTADSIAVAILNRFITVYTPTIRSTNKDVSLVAELSSIPSVEGDFTPNAPYAAYTASNYNIAVYKPYPSTTPSPNDY